MTLRDVAVAQRSNDDYGGTLGPELLVVLAGATLAIVLGSVAAVRVIRTNAASPEAAAPGR